MARGPAPRVKYISDEGFTAGGADLAEGHPREGKNPPGVRRSSTWISPSVRIAAAVPALVVGILLVPLSAGASVGPLVIHHAPFAGVPIAGEFLTTYGCKASASAPVSPSFNLTTGKGVFHGKASATGCGPTTSYDEGLASGSVGYATTPFRVPAGASAVLKFNVTVAYAYKFTATPMNPFGGPFAWAAANITLCGALYDDVTLALVTSVCTSALLTTNSTSSGALSGSTHSPSLIVLPLGSSQGHRLVAELYVILECMAYAPGGTTTASSASVNMAPPGHALTLHHWGIS